MNSTSHNAAMSVAPVVRKVPGRKISPLRSLRSYAAVALLTFIVVMVLGFPVAWKKGNRTYAAQSVVFISPRFLKNLDDDKEFELQSNSQYREFVQQHVKTIDRYDIVEEAVSRLSDERHPWRRPKESLEHAVTRLQGELKILPVPDTYQITVRLEDEQPNNLAETVNSVVAVFLEKSKEEDFYGRDQRMASLKEEARQLSADIDDANKEKDRIAQELAVSVFSESFSNPFDQLLVGSKQNLAAARQKHIVSRAQLASLEQKQSADGATGLQAYASEMASKDADITTFESNSNFRRSELTAKLDGMLPTHPGRLEIENELKQIDQVHQTKQAGLERNYSAMLLAQRRAEVAADAAAERELQQQVEQQAAQAKWYSHNYQRGISIRSEMERARHRLEAIEDRMSFIEQEGHAPGFARLFSPARTPSEPVGGSRKKPILMLFALATALSLAGPIGIDMMDSRLLTPNEVEKCLGFPPIGFTFRLPRDPHNIDRIQRLAAAVERDSARNHSRSFLFVPVNAEAPVFDIVHDIARELVHLGRAQQVIDATSPAPLAHAVAASSGGTSAVPVHNVTPFGAVRGRVQEAPEGVTVLVPAEPFSASPGSELLASCCDVVVLTLQAAHTTKGELQGCMQTLENIQVKAISVLVTGYEPNPPLPRVRLGLRHARSAWMMLRASLSSGERTS